MKNIKTYEEFKETFKEYIDRRYNPGIPPKIFILDIPELDLYNLDGIEEFINLIEFRCYDNKITSLKGIENCSYLELINCTHNKITSLEDLSPNLEKIFCNQNEITTLKGIEKLTKLRILKCEYNPIDWVDYIDKDGRTYYTKLPKSIVIFRSDKFHSIEEYWEFIDKNQPVAVSRKFNF